MIQQQTKSTTSYTTEADDKMEIMILPASHQMILSEGDSMIFCPLNVVTADVLTRLSVKVKVAEQLLHELTSCSDRNIANQAWEALHIMAEDGISFG